MGKLSHLHEGLLDAIAEHATAMVEVCCHLIFGTLTLTSVVYVEERMIKAPAGIVHQL